MIEPGRDTNLDLISLPVVHINTYTTHGIHGMAAPGGSSSISVAVRVRPFTIREAAQISKCEDGPLFLGDGSLAGAPTPKLHQKGIRSIVKVIDDRCL